jgi:hypothetical protein
MTVLHSGTTKKYSENWASAFAKKTAQAANRKTSKRKPARTKARAAGGKKASPKKK